MPRKAKKRTGKQMKLNFKAGTKNLTFDQKMKLHKAGRTMREIGLDLMRQAKPPGKRKSKSGKTYYEYRPNRSDLGRKNSNRI
jgi:hypothetical protein